MEDLTALNEIGDDDFSDGFVTTAGDGDFVDKEIENILLVLGFLLCKQEGRPYRGREKFV